MTKEQIIKLLENELAAAIEIYDLSDDKQKAKFYYHKQLILIRLLDEIENG